MFYQFTFANNCKITTPFAMKPGFASLCKGHTYSEIIGKVSTFPKQWSLGEEIEGGSRYHCGCPQARSGVLRLTRYLVKMPHESIGANRVPVFQCTTMVCKSSPILFSKGVEALWIRINKLKNLGWRSIMSILRLVGFSLDGWILLESIFNPFYQAQSTAFSTKNEREYLTYHGNTTSFEQRPRCVTREPMEEPPINLVRRSDGL